MKPRESWSHHSSHILTGNVDEIWHLIKQIHWIQGSTRCKQDSCWQEETHLNLRAKTYTFLVLWYEHFFAYHAKRINFCQQFQQTLLPIICRTLICKDQCRTLLFVWELKPHTWIHRPFPCSRKALENSFPSRPVCWEACGVGIWTLRRLCMAGVGEAGDLEFVSLPSKCRKCFQRFFWKN